MTKHDDYVPPDPEKMKRAIEFVVPLVLDFIRRRKGLGPTVSKNPEQGTLYKMLSQAAHHIERTFGHAGVRFVSGGWRARTPTTKIVWEHVFPIGVASWFVDDSTPEEEAEERAYRFAQATAVGSLVTTEEHHRLSQLDRPFRVRPSGVTVCPDFTKYPMGFDRYWAASLAVFDRETDTWLIKPTRAMGAEPQT
jgi:hypothetical protein